MSRRCGDGAVVGGDGLRVATELDQGDAAIVMRDWMLRRQRQCRLEVGERAFRKSELALRKPVVKAGLEMLRLAGKHDLQFGKRVARPVEAQQRIGVLIEDVNIV